jgi:hypothetical protein
MVAQSGMVQKGSKKGGCTFTIDYELGLAPDRAK